MNYPTVLQPIAAENLFPIHGFKLTFSQEQEHTNTSATYSGDDISCKIFCTYHCGSYLEEFEDEFPIQERHVQGDGVTEKLFPTKKWAEFWADANPDGRNWRKPPTYPAPKLCDLSARLLLRPTHVEHFHNGDKKRLHWLYGSVAAKAAGPVAQAA